MTKKSIILVVQHSRFIFFELECSLASFDVERFSRRASAFLQVATSVEE